MCFQSVQNQLDRTFIGMFNETEIPEIHLRTFGYRRSYTDEFIDYLKILLPLLLVFSNFFAVTKIVKVSANF